MSTKKKQTKGRIWCEDTSQTYQMIKSHKNNGKTTIKEGVLYEIIGDNILFNPKTNLIEVK